MVNIPDWMLLNRALQILNEHIPDQLSDCKQRYEYKKLKELILATEIFEFIEEPTENEGVRQLYRMKDGWKPERSDG